MANVKIYTKNYCPYCVHAKNLLQNKGVSFTEENLEDNPEEMMALIQKTFDIIKKISGLSAA